MKAIVTHPFKGVEDGNIYPRLIRAGEVITGDLAAVAIEEGWADEVGAEKKSVKAAPRNKMRPSPENKSGSASPPAPRSRKQTASASAKAD